jgi:glycine betaine/proline transport system substrate-binding protein
MNMKKRTNTRLSTALAVLLTLAAAGILASCAPAEQEDQPVSVTFADMTWDSVRVHNRIVAFILQEGYGGYTIDYTQGATTAMATGLRQGDLDVILESWHNNWNDAYDEAMAAGDFLDLGPNYPEAPQGWYVPTYVIEGDGEREIEPMAPDLRSIEDLPEYWEVFKDPEEPDKGRIMVGPPGWEVTETNQQVMEEHGLTENYTAFLPGSDAALKASMESAVRRGDPWLGYHWEPTWILGKLDMTMIEGVGLSSGLVHKLVHPSLEERAPELVGLLERYETTLDQNNAFLAQMQENEWDYEDAAEWYLREYEDEWTTWVDDEVAERVRTALE